MEIDLTAGCDKGPVGKHLFNAHQVCQWCNWEKVDIELIKLRSEVGRLREELERIKAPPIFLESKGG